MYIELTQTELETIEQAAKADVADAARHSTPRWSETSAFDERQFLAARLESAKLLETLRQTPSIAASLAAIVRSIDEELAQRLSDYSESRTVALADAHRQSRLDWQRGALT